MSLRILFFGATAAAAGTREISIELGENSNVAAMTDLVLNEYPLLASHKLLFSLNQEYAGPDTRITDGDELAIFTPVSGG